jgi:hypothetical protein
MSGYIDLEPLALRAQLDAVTKERDEAQLKYQQMARNYNEAIDGQEQMRKEWRAALERERALREAARLAVERNELSGHPLFIPELYEALNKS